MLWNCQWLITDELALLCNLSIDTKSWLLKEKWAKSTKLARWVAQNERTCSQVAFPTSKRSRKCSVDYVEQREALCRFVYAATRARSTFSLGIHIPTLSGSCVPFTRCSTPSLVTRWPTTTTLSSLASDDCSVDTPGSLPFALLPCHRIQLLQQRSTFLIVQCHRGFWLSAVQRRRAWLLLVDLSHSTNFNTLSVHTAKVTHFRFFFLYPRTFLIRTIIFPLCVEQWHLTVVSVFITRLSLPLKSKPHSGFHCTFQCIARRKIFKFKCRWNRLIWFVYMPSVRSVVTEVNWNSFSLLSIYFQYHFRLEDLLCFSSLLRISLYSPWFSLQGYHTFPCWRSSFPVTFRRLHFATFQNSSVLLCSRALIFDG